MELNSNQIKAIQDIIEKKYAQAKIYIYGSYARGKATAESDLDLCILMPKNSMVTRYDFELNQQLTDAIGLEVHCVFCTQFNAWCELELSSYSKDTGLSNL